MAAVSFLLCDPAAPGSLLTHNKERSWKDDPARWPGVLEQYDYAIADPWDLGLTPEDRADLEQQRTAIAEWMESQR